MLFRFIRFKVKATTPTTTAATTTTATTMLYLLFGLGPS